MIQGREPKPLRTAEYRALAQYRYLIRRYLRHIEEACRAAGVNPRQYQVILALKGLPPEQTPTIGTLAERMQLNHNSTVELVDRCEKLGLLRRRRSGPDRRRVELSITSQGEAFLRKLAPAARRELRVVGPILVESILHLIGDSRTALKVKRRPPGGDKKA